MSVLASRGGAGGRARGTLTPSAMRAKDATRLKTAVRTAVCEGSRVSLDVPSLHLLPGGGVSDTLHVCLTSASSRVEKVALAEDEE